MVRRTTEPSVALGAGGAAPEALSTLGDGRAVVVQAYDTRWTYRTSAIEATFVSVHHAVTTGRIDAKVDFSRVPDESSLIFDTLKPLDALCIVIAVADRVGAPAHRAAIVGGILVGRGGAIETLPAGAPAVDSRLVTIEHPAATMAHDAYRGLRPESEPRSTASFAD